MDCTERRKELMIRYKFKVNLYEDILGEAEYILYEKNEGNQAIVHLKPINGLYDMAKFLKCQITSGDRTKVRYYLIFKELEAGWTDREHIAFEEARAYLEKLS